MVVLEVKGEGLRKGSHVMIYSNGLVICEPGKTGVLSIMSLVLDKDWPWNYYSTSGSQLQHKEFSPYCVACFHALSNDCLWIGNSYKDTKIKDGISFIGDDATMMRLQNYLIQQPEYLKALSVRNGLSINDILEERDLEVEIRHLLDHGA